MADVTIDLEAQAPVVLDIEGSVVFPANVVGGNGIAVTREGVDYVIANTEGPLPGPEGPAGPVGPTGPIGAEVRNRLINPDFEVSQAGAISSSVSTYYGGADQWLTFHDGTGLSSTTSIFADASGTPSPASGRYVLANVTKTGGTVMAFVQRIEAIDCADLLGKKVTVTALLYQNTGSTLNVSVHLSAANATNNFTATTDIEYMTPSVAVPSAVWTRLTLTSSAVMPALVRNGLSVGFEFPIGTVSAKNFALGEAGLYVGTAAPPFDAPRYADELRRCQRYWYLGGLWISGYATAGGGIRHSLTLPVQMRTVPIVTFSSTTYGNASSITTYAATIYGIAFSITITATGTGGVDTNWTAIARL